MSHIEYIRQRVKDKETLMRKVANWKLKDMTVVFTNGCFDILHPGHVDYLTRASALGDRMIVAVNSDASVKRLKGSNRPVNTENDRAFVVAGLHYVNAVILFDEDTPAELIRDLQPDVLVKGADYDAQEMDPSSPTFIAGSEYVRAAGGRVETIPLLEGYSTSRMIDKLKA
jgi:rfaE bifunctional protein nucleotidyltransferase chain/domain